jgi:hypothetical protein
MLALVGSTIVMGPNSERVDFVVKALASRQQYPSHGSVIDANEAAQLGLSVTKLGPDDELWQRLWLLRCMYAHDARLAGGAKDFRGAKHQQ